MADKAKFIAWMGALGLAVTCLVTPLHAGGTRTQTIQLKQGWSAVHLEVSPEEADPAAVFANSPVNIVARYFRLGSSVEFITDPGEKLWNLEEWGVWYAPDREDAFLTDLHAIQGNQTYLIHAKEDFLWSVSGEVRFVRRTWRNDSFNLVGFPVDSQSPPTFAQLFEGAGEKIGRKIYRLQDGKWIKLLTPESTRVRPGEAFWTFCSGNTDFQGPIDLELPGSGALDFGNSSQPLTIRWSLNSESSDGLSVEPVSVVGSALPVRRVERDLNNLSESSRLLGAVDRIDTDGARSGKFDLSVHREDLGEVGTDGLLKFSDGKGSVVWVPMEAAPVAE